MGGKLYSKVVWVYITLGVTAAIAIIGWILQDMAGWLKILIMAFLLIAIAAQLLAHKAEKKERDILRYFGKLRGGTVTLLSTRQKVYPKLKLGNSDTFFHWRGPEGQPLFTFLDDTALAIRLENGELKVSTKIRNKNGQLVAEIIGNEWKLKKEKLWDRNYNRSALEVKDEQGDVVLQVLMKEDYIQFAAKMYSSDGYGFAIGSKEFTEEDMRRHTRGESKILATQDGPREVKVGDITAALEKSPPGYPLELFIEPIFKYPSDLHLGERL